MASTQPSATPEQSGAAQHVAEPLSDERSGEQQKRWQASLAGFLSAIWPGMLIALVLTLGLELAHASRNSLVTGIEHVLTLDSRVLLLGWLVVLALVLFLQALTGRLWIAAAIAAGVAGLMAYSDLAKLEFRGEPLYPTDVVYLAELPLLLDTVGAGALVVFVLAVLALTGLFWWLSRLARARRSNSPEGARGNRPRTFTRILVGSVAAAVLLIAATFNQPANALRGAYDVSGARWAPWNQDQNYHDNGFLAGLLYNLPTKAMVEPDGYSEAAMADLVSRYTAIAERVNETRDSAALTDTNVVMILSESLSDPTKMAGISAEDPIPFLRTLMAENPSGTLLSPTYGGGTSTVEFEALTGMAGVNLSPQVNSPLQGVVAQRKTFPSHLTTYQDHYSLALHPFSNTFYRRNEAYPAFGFDEALFRKDLPALGKLPGDRYVSDAAIFGEVVNRLSDSAEPMFLNVVTMQNHGPQDGLLDPFQVDGPLTTAQETAAGQYYSGLRHSDDALRDLVAALEAMPERTIVVLYGDHLPSIWPDDVRKASGATAGNETPWVVFANFPLEQVDSAPIIGANQLFNQVLDAAGANYTAWDALLDELATELPAMEGPRKFDAAGNQISDEALSPRAAHLLHDYQLAQYDMISGEGWGTAQLLDPLH